jgi:Flp pilus assembly protein TadG
MIRLHSDERGFLVAFLLKLILVFLVAGLVVVEGGSIIWARLEASDAADAAAIAAADAFDQNRDVRFAREAAVAAVGREDPEARLVEPFQVEPDGTVHVTVQTRAPTVLVDRIGFTENWAIIRITASGSPAQPGF